jgi:hypothetical protein
MDLAKVRAQAAVLEEYDAVKAQLARNKDAIEQKAHVYHIEVTDHALSHRSIEFEFTPRESVEMFKVVETLLKARLKSIETKLV